MTLFEYLSVAFSIVLSLAAVRLLSGASVSFAKAKRYWPHTMWVMFALLTSAMVWWNFWSFESVSWNFARFLLTLLVPATMYLQAAALVPESPGNVESWREHFFSARVRFFVALAAFFLTIAVVSWVVIDFPLYHPARAVQGVALGLAISGAIATNPRWHHVLPLLFLTLFTIAGFVLFFQPSAMAPAP